MYKTFSSFCLNSKSEKTKFKFSPSNNTIRTSHEKWSVAAVAQLLARLAIAVHSQLLKTF